MSVGVYHLIHRHVAWPFDHCIHEPIVVTGVGTKGIICNLGSAEPTDLKCVILGPKMTYTNGLGCVEPTLMQKCKFAPLFFRICKTPPITPFFAKTIRGTMGLLSSCRIANAIVKRENETLKNLIENGAPDVARATRDTCKALVLELHKLLDQVKNVPRAKRLAPRPTNAGKFDITGGKILFENSGLLGPVVSVLRDNLPDVAFGGVKFSY